MYAVGDSYDAAQSIRIAIIISYRKFVADRVRACTNCNAAISCKRAVSDCYPSADYLRTVNAGHFAAVSYYLCAVAYDDGVNTVLCNKIAVADDDCVLALNLLIDDIVFVVRYDYRILRVRRLLYLGFHSHRRGRRKGQRCGEQTRK